MKTGPDALGTVENEGAHNMKMGPDVLGTPKNMSESGKHENEIVRSRYRRNESGST
jgi:hypothetical protein